MTGARRVWPVALAATLIACAAASVFIGARPTSPTEVMAVLRDGPSAATTVFGDLVHVVWELRVPRTILGLVGGASLAMAGAIAQTWTRNPLADPGIIGITSGAAFAVAVGLTAGVAGSFARAPLAMAGAAAAALFVFGASRASADPLTLILVGVGASAAFTAATTLLALQSHAVLDGMRQWTVGSMSGKTAEDVALAAGGLVLGGVIAAAFARSMDLLVMGDDVAAGLGASPGAVRGAMLAAVVVLAGSATAAVGPVAFVGFAAPHLIRPLTGPSLVRLLPAAAAAGAALTVFADVVGRMVVRPGEVEVSIVLALVGAPLFVYAVRKGERRARS